MPRRSTARKPDPREELRLALKRLIARAGGVSLVLAAGFVALSVASYDVSDPSLSTATGREAIANRGGALGAITADIALQFLGGAVLPLLGILALWGSDAVRFGTPGTTPRTAVLKAACLPFSTVAFAGFLAAMPRSADWPFIVSFGGVFGDGLLALASGLVSFAFLPFPRMIAAALLLGLGLWGFAFAAGLRVLHLAAAVDAILYAAQATGVGAENLLSRLREKVQPHAEDREDDEEPVETLDAELIEGPSQSPVDADIEDIEPLEEVIPQGIRPDRPAPAEKPRIMREVRKVPPRKRAEVRRGRGSYQFPGVQLLKAPNPKDRKVLADADLEDRARMLERVLSDFKIGGEIVKVRPGPVVTLYELEPAAGVKSSRVIGLADDIARSMSAVACRVAVVPGRNAIGIELPNDDREMVYFREMLSTREFAEGKKLNLALGKDIGGDPQYADLAKMPHLLIAGTTGSGKSVGINTMILSLLYRLTPDECKMIMVDPKMLELSVYEGIPHLLAPVVTDPRKAVIALKWVVKEMEERYRRMSKVGVRNISGFNDRVAEANENGEPLIRKVHSGYDPETGEPTYEEEVLDEEKMPFIVVVIDEVADLMMVAGKDIEAMVQRLAQMARAAGIHLIMATQRPSVDVITGTIKANFPTRVSFQVTSKIDSRTILGEQGAEQLLGQGDMLYMAGGGRITRVHGAFVADGEVERIVEHLKSQGKPDYIQEVTEGGEDDDAIASQLGLDLGGNTGSGDALFDQAVAIVARDRKASTSYLQRRLQIGYNRAASLIEKLEDEGIVSPANHAGKREILIGEDAA